MIVGGWSGHSDSNSQFSKMLTLSYQVEFTILFLLKKFWLFAIKFFVVPSKTYNSLMGDRLFFGPWGWAEILAQEVWSMSIATMILVNHQPLPFFRILFDFEALRADTDKSADISAF